MRLRRETGDFDVVINQGTATIEKGLNAECLIGCIIVNGTETAAVSAITTGSGTLTMTAGTGTYIYTVETGVVTVSEG